VDVVLVICCAFAAGAAMPSAPRIAAAEVTANADRNMEILQIRNVMHRAPQCAVQMSGM
jgi:hypothetical protein